MVAVAMVAVAVGVLPLQGGLAWWLSIPAGLALGFGAGLLAGHAAGGLSGGVIAAVAGGRGDAGGGGACCSGQITGGRRVVAGRRDVAPCRGADGRIRRGPDHGRLMDGLD